MSDFTTCSCGATCRTHGIITFEDRDAAYQAGYQAGVVAGRLQNVRAEVGALCSAAELLDWVQVRTLAMAKSGPEWADMVAGPMPGGDRR